MRWIAIAFLIAGCGSEPGGGVDTCSARCGDVCVDSATDPMHCGGCNNACSQFCESGACVASCSTGRQACNGSCVDTSSDPLHCGGCDNPCSADAAICEAGRCVATSTCATMPDAPGGGCPAECTGGCQGNICTIDCSGNGAPCDGSNIVCPTNFDCVVVCNGIDACDSGTIACPPDHSCTVICGGGNDACGDQVITCGAGSCRVDCAADACQGANVMCGGGPCSAACGMPAPTVTCGAACACAGC